MDNKNFKRRNEALKEVVEAQQDIADFNRNIDNDICKINMALMYGDNAQREECRYDIVRKYPNYAHYLDNREFVSNLLCVDPTTLLGLQKIALMNMKNNHCFQEYIKLGVKLNEKWKNEDAKDGSFDK